MYRVFTMKNIAIAVALMIMMHASCKKNEQGYVENLRAIQSLFEEQKYEESLQFMTSATKKSIRRLMLNFPGIAEAGFGMGVLFRKGAEWEIVEEKVEGDNAKVKVRYMRHPVENIKGSETVFIFKKESGEWRLDMEKEIDGFVAEMQEAEKQFR